MLARLGRADPQLLSPIKHRSKQGQRALLWIQVREKLVRSRVNQVNSVRCLLKSLGLAVPGGAKEMTFTRRLRPLRDAATRSLVEPLLAMSDVLNSKIAELGKELERFGSERYPATERLPQIPGVGPLTALVFVLTIEDPAALFANARCRSVPRFGAATRPVGRVRQAVADHQAGNTQLR